MTVRIGDCVRCGRGVGRVDRNLCARCHGAAQHAPLKQPCPRCGKDKALKTGHRQVRELLPHLPVLPGSGARQRPRPVRALPPPRPA
jgi:primosomal protein N'